MSVTTRPAARLIRAVFERESRRLSAAMEAHVTHEVRARIDVPYADLGRPTTLDVFSPPSAAAALPAVVWVHGGAWISGCKEDVSPYLRILAAHDLVTVGVNYPVPPAASYPAALQRLDEALRFLLDNAAEYGVDPDRIVLAGDSAGANLVSQLATAITCPEYADRLGLRPALAVHQLRGVVLHCGIYDVSGVPQLRGLAGWGFRVALRAYLGASSDGASGRQMSTLHWVTERFPPAWVCGGNGDPLTTSQSRPLVARLEALGVPVTAHFVADGTTPAMPHEFQFHLDAPPARAALESTLGFLDRVAR